MAGLVKREPDDVTRRGTHAQAGRSRDVNSADWSGTALTFADLGALPPEGGGAPVCDSAQQLRGVRRRRNGSYYRRRVGWQADRKRVVVAYSDQELRPRPDGRMEPAGVWQVTNVDVHTGTRVSRRVGDVAHLHDTAAYPETDAAVTEMLMAEGESDPGLGPDEQDLSYLPPVVRDGLLQAVPTTSVAVAEALRFSSHSGGPTHHTVKALRLGAEVAVVVHASLQAGGRAWQVEQVTYELSPEQPRLSGFPTSGIDR